MTHEARNFLEDSEERFRTLVANIPGAVYRCAWDDQLQGLPLRRMVFLSEAIQEISGYASSDFINNRVRSFTSIIHPQDRAKIEEVIWQSIRIKQPYVIEYRVIQPDGNLVWVYDKGQGIFSENGEILWLDGVILDITERKKTEANLRDTQTFLNSILENLPISVFIKDAKELNIVYWNKASEELFGYSREEVLSKNDYDFLPKEQARYSRAKDRRVLAEGTLIDIPEEPTVTPHRGKRWLHTKKVPLLDERDTPRYLLSICEDITERKRAQEALRESETHYRRIVETASEGIWMFDAESKTTFANSRIAQMLGYTVAQMLGRSLLDFMDEDSRMQAQAYVERRRQGIHERHDFKFRRKNGSVLWAIVSATPIFDAEGQFVGVLRMITDISDVHNELRLRKQAEEALRESHQQIANILERITDAFFALDDQWRFTYINSEASVALQQNPKELIGANFWDVFPEVVGSLVEQQYRQAITEQVPAIFETFSERLSSWIEVRAYPSGSGLSVFWRDITEHKQAQEALRKSEEQYRTLASHFPHGAVLAFDRDLRYTLVEGEALAALGLSKELVEGKTLWEVRTPEICDILEPRYRAALSGVAEVFEMQYAHRTYLVHTLPLKNAWGEVFAGMVMKQDITERKQAEEALRESERRFRAIFDSMFQFIGLLKPDGTLLEANQTALDFGGFRLDHIAGLPFWETPWWSLSTQTQERLKTAIAQAASGEFVRYEVDVVGAGDRVITIDFSIKPIKDEMGQVVLLIPEGRDISDKKQAEKALRRSESQLRTKNQELQETLHQLKRTQAQLIQNEKMVSLGQMVAGIAHEINNPVSFIYGNVTYANEYAQNLLNLIKLYGLYYPEPVAAIQEEIQAFDLNFVADDFPKVLRSMKEGANRIREIVLSLRNFSRLDEAEIKPVDLHEGIDNTLLILQHRLKGHAGKPETEVRKQYGQLPLVECYANSINQVFMNLLCNAIDALEPQPAPRVITIHTSFIQKPDERVSSATDKSWHPTRSKFKKPNKSHLSSNSSFVVIRITDNGPGIPLEVKKQIFDPFFTTKPIGVGTGLGLSIAYSIIVERHGGTMICNSTPGEGAEFVIELPVQQLQSST
ncbi:MAG: PAS domain S-box protein [Cyanobacteriota bacterium]